jgi:hypothetical protein
MANNPNLIAWNFKDQCGLSINIYKCQNNKEGSIILLTFNMLSLHNSGVDVDLEHVHMCLYLYSYMYEIKLLVSEIGQLVDDFHLLQFEKWHPNSSQ